MLFDPGEVIYSCPFFGLDNVALWFSETIGLPDVYTFRSSITSAFACGLQFFLPTLNLLHCCNPPKAGYEICWVYTFSTVLSTASTSALRGAPLNHFTVPLILSAMTIPLLVSYFIVSASPIKSTAVYWRVAPP